MALVLSSDIMKNKFNMVQLFGHRSLVTRHTSVFTYRSIGNIGPLLSKNPPCRTHPYSFPQVTWALRWHSSTPVGGTGETSGKSHANQVPCSVTLNEYTDCYQSCEQGRISFRVAMLVSVPYAGGKKIYR